MAHLLTPKPDSSDELEASERWAAIEKAAGSEEFRRSVRLREFLLYVGSQQINGHPEEISEQLIGHRVYRRSENYNPTEDNIVRVSARQLRAKLREYYEGEGIHDPWLVEIPKGGYIPQFRQREQASVREPNSVPPAAEVQPPRERHLSRWLIPLVAAFAAAVATWLIQSRISHGTAGGTSDPAGIHNPTLITALFAASPKPLQVVVSDSAASVMAVIAGHEFTFNEYASQTYRQPPARITTDTQAMQVWTTLAARQLVNLGDIGAINQFSKALSDSGNKTGVVMRSARDIRPRDFRSGNFILLGSSSSNPWVQLFGANRFGFRFVDLPWSIQIRDTHPERGEPELYTQLNSRNEGYARIALVPNLTNSGKVLLIAGTSMESTEAASSFSLNARSLRTLLTALHVNDASQLPSFEALLRTREQGGTGVNAELITARKLNPE